MKRPKLIEHGRRGILLRNVTRHPTPEWVVWQLREAFPDACPDLYAILDRDSKFDADVITFLKATGLRPTGSRNVGWAVVAARSSTMWPR